MADITRATCALFGARWDWRGMSGIRCGPAGRMRMATAGSAAERDAIYACCCVGGAECPRRAMDCAGDGADNCGGVDMDELLSGRGAGTPSVRRLSEIEYEIHDRLTRAAGELLAVGRCLCEVRDSELVPAGQWGEWLRAHTGMSERSAQRYMQAAREVLPGSPLERLSMGKITALLTLPSGEREAFAAAHDAESASVRELQRAVARERDARERAEQDARVANELAERAVRNAHEQAEQAARDAREQAERAAQDELEQNVHDAEVRIQQRYEGQRQLLERMQTAKAAADETIAELQDKIAQLERGQLSMDDGELERLKREIERQARLRSEAQAEVIRLRKQLAQGGGAASSAANALSADMLRQAANEFLARAGAFPHMRMELAALDNQQAAAYRASVDMLEMWCRQAREAMRTVVAEVVSIR